MSIPSLPRAGRLPPRTGLVLCANVISGKFSARARPRRWTGGIRSHSEFVLERDPCVIANRQRLFPDCRNDIFVRNIVPVLLCSDCAGIGAALTQRDQSIRDPYLSVADRRATIMVAQPHCAHEIDFEAAAQRALANNSHGPAYQAFNAFLARVSDFAGRFDRGRRCGLTEQALFEELAEDIRVFHRIDNAAECLNLAKWPYSEWNDRKGSPSGSATPAKRNEARSVLLTSLISDCGGDCGDSAFNSCAPPTLRTHSRHPEVRAERASKGDGRAPRPHPSRAASRPPQDDESYYANQTNENTDASVS